jgi:hypothetical protein
MMIAAMTMAMAMGVESLPEPDDPGGTPCPDGAGDKLAVGAPPAVCPGVSVGGPVDADG